MDISPPSRNPFIDPAVAVAPQETSSTALNEAAALLQTYIGDPGTPHYERLFCRSIAVLQWIDQQNQSDRYLRDKEWHEDRHDMLLDTLDLPPVNVRTGTRLPPKEARDATRHLAQALMPLFSQEHTREALSADDVLPLMKSIANSYAQSAGIEDSDGILQGFRDSCVPSDTTEERLLTDPATYARKAWLALSPPGQQSFRMSIDQEIARMDAELSDDHSPAGDSPQTLEFIHSLARNDNREWPDLPPGELHWPDLPPRVAAEWDRYRDGFRNRATAIRPSERPELAEDNLKCTQAARVIHEALGLPFDAAIFDHGLEQKKLPESRLRHFDNLVSDLTDDPILARRFRRLRRQDGMTSFVEFLDRARFELKPSRQGRGLIKAVPRPRDPERLKDITEWLWDLSDDDALRSDTLRECQRLSGKRNKNIHSSFESQCSLLLQLRTTRDASKGKYDQDVSGLAKRALQDFYMQKKGRSRKETEAQRWWPAVDADSGPADAPAPAPASTPAPSSRKRMAPFAAMPPPAKRHKPDAVMSVYEMRALSERVRSMDFVFSYPPMKETLRRLAGASYDRLAAELAAHRPLVSEEQDISDLSSAQKAWHKQKEELVSLASPMLSRLQAVQNLLKGTLPQAQLSWLFDAADDAAAKVASLANDASRQLARVESKTPRFSTAPLSVVRQMEALMPPEQIPRNLAGTIDHRPAAQPAWSEEAIRAQFQLYAGQSHTAGHPRLCVRLLSAAAAIQRLDTSGRSVDASELRDQLRGLLIRTADNYGVKNPLQMTVQQNQAQKDRMYGQDALITTLASRTQHDDMYGQGSFIPKFVRAILAEATIDSGHAEAVYTQTIDRAQADIEDDDTLIEAASKYAMSLWPALATDGQRNLRGMASEYIRELEQRHATAPGSVDWRREWIKFAELGFGSLPDFPVTLVDAIERRRAVLRKQTDTPDTPPTSKHWNDETRVRERTARLGRERLVLAMTNFLGRDGLHTPGLLTGISALEAEVTNWNDGGTDVSPRLWRASRKESGATAFTDLLRKLKQELAFKADLNRIVPDTLAALATNETLRNQAIEIARQAGDDVQDRPVRVLVQVMEALTLHQVTQGSHDGDLDKLLKVERATFELQKWEEMENARRGAIWSGHRSPSPALFNRGYRPSLVNASRKQNELLPIQTPDISSNEQEMERLATAVHALPRSEFLSFLRRKNSPWQAAWDRLDPADLAAATSALDRLGLNPASAAEVGTAASDSGSAA